MEFTTSQLAWSQSLLDEYHMLSAEVTEAHGALFLRNPDAPALHGANHVRRIRHGAEDDVDAFVAALDAHYAGLPYRAVCTDWFTPPPIEARLLADGYSCDTMLVLGTDALALAGAVPEVCEVRAQLFDAPDLAALFEVEHGDLWPEEWTLAQRRGDAYRWLAAFHGDVAIGHIAWRTRDRVGNLESLYVLPEHRQHGVATTLLHAAFEASHAAGAGLVCLVTAAEETTKDLYRRLGFVPMYAVRNYCRAV